MNARRAIHRMRGGKEEGSEQGGDYGTNFDNQSFSSERGFFVRKEDKSKGGSSSASYDIMGGHIPTSSQPQRYSSVPTHAPYQRPSSGSSPWSPVPSQDNTSMSSQTLCGSAYGPRPPYNQMRQSSEPVMQGGGQQAGGPWVLGPQTQFYEEPTTVNNPPGYIQPSAENHYAQQDPRSASVGPYHAQQGAGQGNYTLQPSRDSYSGAAYQPAFCCHRIPYVSFYIVEFSHLYRLIWLLVTTNAQSATADTETQTLTEPRAESDTCSPMNPTFPANCS